MKTTFFTLLFALAALSFATENNCSKAENQSLKTSSISDSTETPSVPEGIKETEPHFEIDGRKFWIVVDNNRSAETYDESSEVYQYYSQIPETLFNLQEGVTHATFVYKGSKSIYALVEIKNE